ncbi:Lateral flagellin [Shewanella sp. D64]|uniref:flagellin N-terminal helical domain-containing protein n=1 Tax=unclassified Shewanella TaxID=196818 RepID=UPI0022BA313E|nr:MULTISPECIES: flagellin [unclassified Shewanella]MEC4725934.1 Lateral flagellin [Shewanella sp. D64]MEC4737189.1 Lateral flagellin [Shewanella sp. E94]WBJ95619.1 Lateral flagellin [Shewanella sp. MTB7]
MLSVMTNNASNIAQNSVTKSNDLLSNAMERLSTGLRINSAADDAAGLQIATRLNANVTGMETANRNVSDATSMLQTADGALDELNNIATRQKELATQAANGVNSAEDLVALNTEFAELTKEVTRIVENTEYSGNKLFDTLNAEVEFQIGAGATEQMKVKVDKANLAGVADDISAVGAAKAAITKVDEFIDKVGTERSNLGANINRLGHTASNLTNVTENTKAAAGRIMDTDFAVETAAMTKNQLLVQAGTNILSSANQNTGLVMGLLG